MDVTDIVITDPLVDRIQRAIGPAARVAYAATHVYPMGAPNFKATPLAEREYPACDTMRLYVHIPFCSYACNFCFFATKVGASREQMESYVDALLAELEWVERGTGLSQMFVGGGTPTSLPPDLLDRVLGTILDRMPSTGTGVHTIETSPETVTPEHLEVIKKHGIGRVSMGIQSLDEATLSGVNRRHSVDQALSACHTLAGSGLISNVDLIYGLPDQTYESFQRDMQLVSDAGVPSMTLYNLRLNEQTPLAKFISEEQRLYLASLMRWRKFVKQAASDLGFTQTRWHTFKRLNTIAAKHEQLPCFDQKVGGYQLGIGNSARSHLGSAVYRNHPDLKTYLDRIGKGQNPVEETFTLGEADRKTQFVARSLGDGKRLNRNEYQTAFARPIEEDFGQLLDQLLDAELIEEDGELISLTELGRLVHDVITLAFYPDYARHWMQQRQHLNFAERMPVDA